MYKVPFIFNAHWYFCIIEFYLIENLSIRLFTYQCTISHCFRKKKNHWIIESHALFKLNLFVHYRLKHFNTALFPILFSSVRQFYELPNYWIFVLLSTMYFFFSFLFHWEDTVNGYPRQNFKSCFHFSISITSIWIIESHVTNDKLQLRQKHTLSSQQSIYYISNIIPFSFFVSFFFTLYNNSTKIQSCSTS